MTQRKGTSHQWTSSEVVTSGHQSPVCVSAGLHRVGVGVGLNLRTCISHLIFFIFQLILQKACILINYHSVMPISAMPEIFRVICRFTQKMFCYCIRVLTVDVGNWFPYRLAANKKACSKVLHHNNGCTLHIRSPSRHHLNWSLYYFSCFYVNYIPNVVSISSKFFNNDCKLYRKPWGIMTIMLC